MDMDACTCLGYTDDDSPSFYRETESKCRVPKQCCGCQGTVEKGQRKLTIVGVWEGHLFTYIYHAHCYNLLRAVSNKYELGLLLGCDFNHCIEGWYNHAREHNDTKVLALVEAVTKA